MSFVFVSHAAPDKPRIKPLIEVLSVHHGLRFWLDRPGHGESHFGFDQEFIDKYGIVGIRSGEDWRRAIQSAVRESAAILACFSRNWNSERTVLHQELVLAEQHDKLVACVLDDMPFAELASNLGLADATRLQAARIDTDALRSAVAQLSAPAPALGDELLSGDSATAWKIADGLARDIHNVIEQSGHFSASSAQIAAAMATLLRVPEYPAVRAHEIPEELAALLSQRFDAPGKARKFLAFAMQMRSQCNPDGFTDRQIIVSPGDVPSPEAIPAMEYWDSVLCMAGVKSRRTLAAILVAPGGLSPARLQPNQAARLKSFLAWLESPSS